MLKNSAYSLAKFLCTTNDHYIIISICCGKEFFAYLYVSNRLLSAQINKVRLYGCFRLSRGRTSGTDNSVSLLSEINVCSPQNRFLVSERSAKSAKICNEKTLGNKSVMFNELNLIAKKTGFIRT